MKKWPFFKNKLDEMQQQKKLLIDSRGFWLTWAALLIVILVEGINEAGFQQIGGEWIVFMLMCLYGLVEYTRNGIWTSYDTKPTLLTNFFWSLLAGVGMTAYVFYRNSHQDWWRPEYWFGPVASGLFVTGLALVCLQINAWFYYKRRHHLDEETEEDGAPYTKEESK